jgi:DNA-binding beta-propeller fold protein YncE
MTHGRSIVLRPIPTRASRLPARSHPSRRHRATGKSGAGRRGALALVCLSLLALAGLLGAPSASGALTHPFLSEFTGSDTPGGSLGTGTSADKLAVEQSTGNVWVIDKQHAVLDKFDASGSYISQIAFGPWGADPDVAVDNSGTATQGHVAAAAEFGPVRVFDSSGTPLFQLDGSTTPDGAFNDDCGLAIDPNNGDIYVAEFGQQVIDKFDSAGNFITQLPVGFGLCDIAVDSDGTIWAVQWNNSLHKLNSSGVDQGVIDPNNPSGVNIDPATHHVYSDRRSSIAEYDSSGSLVGEFGASLLQDSRGVDINGASGRVYVTSNPPAGGRVEIFGPAAVVPDVTTGNATNVTATGATLNGHVDPAGGGNITNCHFDYGTDTSYGNSAPCVPGTPISSPTDVSAQISGLTSCTVYHFRLVAANVNGANIGSDQTFLSGFSASSPTGCFGSQGSGPGQFQSPLGVAVQQSSGNVFVVDSGNARVEKFTAGGSFLLAFGQGRLSSPRSIAIDSLGKVYVGDAGTNTVVRFDANGNFVSTIDGSSAPQGHFQSLAGVAVDQANNLWVADAGTSNVIEFNSKGKFVRQWNDKNGSLSAIAADSAHNVVYLIDAGGYVDRYSLTGNWQREIDRPVLYLGTFSSTVPSALALDRGTGNVYVDHTGTPADVTVYNPTGIKLDDIPLGGSNSQGLAFATLPGGSGQPGQQRLYVSDATLNNVTIYNPPMTPGAPRITSESVDQTGKTTATLHAGIRPLGSATSCHFQYVGNADFQASGFANATNVPCTPSSLGSGFGYVAASASLSGLTTGAYYHFRVVATSSAGTTTGAHQEFQAGPGLWAPNYRCPVDDPAMLSTDGVNAIGFCLASNSTHGSIKIGNLATQTTGNTNLQAGVVVEGSTFTIVPPSGGALVADPVDIPNTPVGTVTAVTQSAGTPSDFDLLAGIQTGVPIITLPIKIQLQNPALGPSCFIGSDQDPIVLHPANTDLSNATVDFGVFFDPNGAPNPSGPMGTIATYGAVQGDDTFSVPGATGCGPNGDGSLDAVVNAVVGLPSPSGNNHLVLEDATSAIALAGGFGGGTGQQLSDYWHVAFGP